MYIFKEMSVNQMSPIFDLRGAFVTGCEALGIPVSVSSILWLPLPVLSVIIVATLGVLVLVWLERKISAAVQQRVGPEYAGALGLLQPLADGVKLIFKEDIVPAKADRWLFTVGPALVVVPVFLSYLIVPFGENLIVADLRIGIFFWIAISSVAPIGLLMSGYGSNNKYAFLGGLRAAAQSLSYELPLAICVLAVCVASDSLQTPTIVHQQETFGLLSWNIWRQPIGFIAFVISALAECERLPFDLPEAEEELVAGYQTEYCGMKFGLFYVGSYVNIFVSACLASVLYLGGWSAPIPIEWIWSDPSPGGQVITAFIGIIWTLLKAYGFVFLTVLTRWTLPRVRIDQLLDLGWKFLLPISLGNLLLTAAIQLVF